MHLRDHLNAPALVSAVLFAVIASASHAVPANPLRPLSAQTCEAALARLGEARIGSPLVPASSHPHLLAVARADVVRLCGAEYLNEHAPNPPPVTP